MRIYKTRREAQVVLRRLYLAGNDPGSATARRVIDALCKRPEFVVQAWPMAVNMLSEPDQAQERGDCDPDSAGA